MYCHFHRHYYQHCNSSEIRFPACSVRSVFPGAPRPAAGRTDLSVLAHPRRGQPPLAREVPRGRSHGRPRNAQHPPPEDFSKRIHLFHLEGKKPA